MTMFPVQTRGLHIWNLPELSLQIFVPTWCKVGNSCLPCQSRQDVFHSGLEIDSDSWRLQADPEGLVTLSTYYFLHLSKTQPGQKQLLFIIDFLSPSLIFWLSRLLSLELEFDCKRLEASWPFCLITQLCLRVSTCPCLFMTNVE